MGVSRSQLPRRDTSRAHVGLSADAIVTAALALLDETGVDRFTIRALADRLGVRAPTIYWHTGSKAKLLELIAERVVSDMAGLASSDGSWDERLRHFLATARECLLVHAGVPELLRTVHTQAFEQWISVAFNVMIDAGFDEQRAAVYARIAMGHAMGSAQSELAARTTPYLEPVPGTMQRSFRVRAGALRAGLPQHVIAMTSFDLDEQHGTYDEIFIAGVRAASERARRR